MIAMNDASDLPPGSRLASHLIELLERERESLARALHDELGSNLTAINLDLASVAAQLPDGVSRTRLERALRVLKDTVELKRRLIQSLRPSMIDSLGLVPTLRMEVDAFESRTRIVCNCTLCDEPANLGQGRALALYRVAQCALQHIEDGASASRVELELRVDADCLSLRIDDDGTYVVPDIDRLTMEAQLARYAGSLTFARLAAGGTRLLATLPLTGS
jgi:signal transduction histidine kinase